MIKQYDLNMPEGGDVVDSLIANKMCRRNWNGLDSLSSYPRKTRDRKRLRKIINDGAQAVPKEWEDADPWLNPCMDALKDEPHHPPELPVELFGETWAENIRCNAKAQSTSEDYVAASLLVVAASLIGNARRGAPTPEWSEPTILWGALVGKAGSNKTQAFKAILKYIKPIEKRYACEYKDAVTQWEVECETINNGENNETLKEDEDFNE